MSTMPNLTHRLFRGLAIAASFPLACDIATAQCGNFWRPGAVPGTNGAVRASTLWDPDGAGPATPRWVVAGQFTIAGGQAVFNVAAWDPGAATWSPLGASLGSVFSLAVAANGDLIAGTGFASAGGSLMRWNGATWVPFAQGLAPFPTPVPMGGAVFSLAVLPNGDVVAGGNLSVPGVPGTNGIARWDGTSWSALGAGSAEYVRAMTVRPNGDLIAGGTFASAPGIGRWNGTSWSSLGAGSGSIHALCTLPNGDVIAGGGFNSIGGAASANVARWDGVSWSALGGGTDFMVLATAPLASGGFVAGGAFTTAGGVPASKIARWNGASWSALGSGMGAPITEVVRTLRELPGGDIAAGGEFTTAGGSAAGRVAIWNGATWSALGVGFAVLPSARVIAAAVAPNGDVIVAGSFATSGTPGANSIARWNGSTWSPLGSGFPYDQSNPPVNAVAVMPNGDVIAGGRFTAAGGVAANRIARWNGTTWSALGAGFAVDVQSLLALPNGDLLAGGNFGSISRWNGVAWSSIGTGLNGSVMALARLPNGDVIAGGYFSQISGVFTGSVARWNGTAWSGVGTAVGIGVRAVAAMPNGDVVIGGSFTTAGGVPANYVARWNGTAWSALGAGTNFDVFGLAPLPNGDLVATGLFNAAGGAPANGIARWNGTAWSPLGAGLTLAVHGSCVLMLDSHLLVGGGFTSAGGNPSPYVARLDTTCPAVANPSGNGCPSSGGVNSLAADTLPWIGATFTASGTGLPMTALVVTVTGFSSIAQGLAPLSLAFPQAGAGCDVLVAPDILGLSITTTGTASSSIALPNTLALAGVTFHHQMVPIEVDLQGAWTSVTATNALQLTVGAF